MNEVIILNVEDELKVFSSQESIEKWLLGNEDEEMGLEMIEQLIENHYCDTMYAHYTWDLYAVDEEV